MINKAHYYLLPMIVVGIMTASTSFAEQPTDDQGVHSPEQSGSSKVSTRSPDKQSDKDSGKNASSSSDGTVADKPRSDNATDQSQAHGSSSDQGSKRVSKNEDGENKGRKKDSKDKASDSNMEESKSSSKQSLTHDSKNTGGPSAVGNDHSSKAFPPAIVKGTFRKPSGSVSPTAASGSIAGNYRSRYHSSTASVGGPTQKAKTVGIIRTGIRPKY